MPTGYLLDSDCFRLYTTGDPAIVQRVRARVDSIWLSSVTAEELIVGRLSIINRTRSGRAPVSLAEAHEEFAELLTDIRPFPMRVYD